jgi:NADPH:quinone reductase
MRAVGYQSPGPISNEASLVDIELPKPEPRGRDILVSVKAVSVNPVDTKVRRRAGAEPGQWKVLGWDAAGVVTATGPDVSLFKPGDEVYYAGALERQGTNAEFHLVDERIVGKKPTSLSFAQAAALPLTAITAWETLFDRLDVKKPVSGAPNAILIIGGAGGVGSIAVQLARKLTGITVIATASRAETQNWVRDLGAHHVVDHTKPLAAEISALRIGAPPFVFSTTNTSSHLAQIVELIAPQGRLGGAERPGARSFLKAFEGEAMDALRLSIAGIFGRRVGTAPAAIRNLGKGTGCLFPQSKRPVCGCRVDGRKMIA